MESLEVDVRKLQLFNDLAKEGTKTVAQNLQMMSDIDTSSEVTKLNFLNYDDVKTHVNTSTADGPQVGIHVDLEDPPYGHFLFLISGVESKRLANALLGKDLNVSDADLDPMQQSAIEEVANIMTSAFIDGWANVLGTTIVHTPPRFVYGESGGILDTVVDWPEDEGGVADIVFVIDGTVSAENVKLDLVCYNFPDLHALVDIIHDIDVEGYSAGDEDATDFSDLQ
jgi:chemotaxis protein CheC